MLSDRLLELGGLAELQRIASGKSPWAVIATLLLIGSVGVIVDYVRMLWLRSKMVSAGHESVVYPGQHPPNNLSRSRPALYPCR